VVKALDGVDFDLAEGETLGLVGETGCGKSVTATSILRLIPQPPGKIEEGECLFDVPPDALARIDALEAQVREVLPRIFPVRLEGLQPADLGANRLPGLLAAAQKVAPKGSPDLESLRLATAALAKLKQRDVEATRGVRAEIGTLESKVQEAVSGIIRAVEEQASPPDLSVRRLRALWAAAQRTAPEGSPDLETLRVASATLLKLKQRYDLLLKSDQEMQAIRGNKIAMIFQEPMQALNPVFPIGDQIAENIVLHQRPAVVKALVEKMELEVERDALAKQLREKDPRGAAAPGRAPVAPPPRSLWVALSALVWIGLSGISLGLYGLALSNPAALPYGGTFAGLLVGGALAVLAIIVSAVLFQMDPRARVIGIVVAVLEILSRATLLVFPFEGTLRLFLGLALLGDLGIVYFLTRPTTSARFAGRALGLQAALLQAEGDPDNLIDLRDAVAASRIPEAQREALLAGVERLMAKATVLLGQDEAITGHLHPGLPRGLQLSFYRRMRDSPGSVGIRFLLWVPVLRRPFARPLDEEGVRWAVAMLRKVKISDPERIAGQYPYELSGGMQQRALIAIALSCNPRLLVADEPTTALDVTIQAQILDLIRELKSTFGSTVLLITHDLGIIAEMCNRVCVMYAGTIAEDAPVRSIFKAPYHPYTQGLMKAVPSHTVRKEELEIIRGSVPNLIRPPAGCRFHPRCPAVMPKCRTLKPPVYEPEPGHKVACWLYEKSLQEIVSGGRSRG